MSEALATPLMGATLVLLLLLCSWWFIVEWGFNEPSRNKRVSPKKRGRINRSQHNRNAAKTSVTAGAESATLQTGNGKSDTRHSTSSDSEQQAHRQPKAHSARNATQPRASHSLEKNAAPAFSHPKDATPGNNKPLHSNRATTFENGGAQSRDSRGSDSKQTANHQVAGETATQLKSAGQNNHTQPTTIENRRSGNNTKDTINNSEQTARTDTVSSQREHTSRNADTRTPGKTGAKEQNLPGAAGLRTTAPAAQTNNTPTDRPASKPDRSAENKRDLSTGDSKTGQQTQPAVTGSTLQPVTDKVGAGTAVDPSSQQSTEQPRTNPSLAKSVATSQQPDMSDNGTSAAKGATTPAASGPLEKAVAADIKTSSATGTDKRSHTAAATCASDQTLSASGKHTSGSPDTSTDGSGQSTTTIETRTSGGPDTSSRSGHRTTTQTTPDTNTESATAKDKRTAGSDNTTAPQQTSQTARYQTAAKARTPSNLVEASIQIQPPDGRASYKESNHQPKKHLPAAGQMTTAQEPGAQTRTDQTRTDQTRTGQNRTDQNRTDQNRTDQNRTEQTGTEQTGTDQNRTDQNRASQNRTGPNKTDQSKSREIKAGHHAEKLPTQPGLNKTSVQANRALTQTPRTGTDNPATVSNGKETTNSAAGNQPPKRDKQKTQHPASNISSIQSAPIRGKLSTQASNAKDTSNKPVALHPENKNPQGNRKQSPIEIAVAKQATSQTDSSTGNATDATAQRQSNTESSINASPLKAISDGDTVNRSQERQSTETQAADSHTPESQADTALRAKLASTEQRIKRLQSALTGLQEASATDSASTTRGVGDAPARTKSHSRPTLLSKVRILEKPSV